MLDIVHTLPSQVTGFDKYVILSIILFAKLDIYCYVCMEKL